jgi:hypothetical protein
VPEPAAGVRANLSRSSESRFACFRTAGRQRGDAASWAPHIADGFCTFNDLHAMIAFVGARDWNLARRLERELAQLQSHPTRHGDTTRLIGLPACRALIAFGRREYPAAIRLLAGLPALAHRIGGSHAQRDVLHLTLRRAMEHMSAPASRLRRAERTESGKLAQADKPMARRPTSVRGLLRHSAVIRASTSSSAARQRPEE